MKFTGTENYVATEDLQQAVEAAVVLQKPLLIKGEPGNHWAVKGGDVSDPSLAACGNQITSPP